MSSLRTLLVGAALLAACTSGEAVADRSVSKTLFIHENLRVLAYSEGIQWIGEEPDVLERVGRPLQVIVTVQAVEATVSFREEARCNQTGIVLRGTIDGLEMVQVSVTEIGCMPTSRHDEDDAAREILVEVQGAYLDGEMLVLTVPWGEVRLRREP